MFLSQNEGKNVRNRSWGKKHTKVYLFIPFTLRLQHNNKNRKKKSGDRLSRLVQVHVSFILTEAATSPKKTLARPAHGNNILPFLANWSTRTLYYFLASHSKGTLYSFYPISPHVHCILFSQSEHTCIVLFLTNHSKLSFHSFLANQE